MGPSIQERIAQPFLDKFAQEKETMERTKALNDALNNRGLDAQSRAEIQNMYDKGANSATLAQYYKDAAEGKSGMFKVRKVMKNEADILKERPGRNQLLSLGKNSPLGGGL